MSSNFYSVAKTPILDAETVAQDILEMGAIGDDKVLRFHAFHVTQMTEFGDGAEEFITVKIIRGHTSAGAGGDDAETQRMANSGQLLQGDHFANNTTLASGGTPVTLHTEDFNVRLGWHFVPKPKMRIEHTQSQGLLVVRLSAPADSVTFAIQAIVELLG